MDEDESDDKNEPAEKVKVDKDQIKERVKAGDYDLSLHFSHKGMLEADPQLRISSLAAIKATAQKKKGQLELFLSAPSANQILCYGADLKSDDPFKLK